MEKKLLKLKKLLSALLILSLVIGYVPTGTFAGTQEQTTQEAVGGEDVVGLKAELTYEILQAPSSEQEAPSNDSGPKQEDGPAAEEPEQSEVEDSGLAGEVLALDSDGKIIDNADISPLGDTMVVDPGIVTYKYVDANDQRKAGWYAGIRVYAPDGMVGQDDLKDAVIRTRGIGDWSEPMVFWNVQDSDPNKDEARYVDVWYYLDADRLYCAPESSLSYGFQADWNGNGLYDQTVTLDLKKDKITLNRVTVGIVDLLKADGTVDTTFDAAGIVAPGEKTYAWVDGTGRPQAGWYVGIRVHGTEAVADGASFQLRTTGDWSAVYSYSENKNEDNSVDVWYYVDEARLQQAKVNGKMLNYGFRADWDKDGCYEHVVVLQLDPATITLKDENAQTAYPVELKGGVIALDSDGKTIDNAQISQPGDTMVVDPGTVTYKYVDANGRPKAGWYAGIRVTAPAFMQEKGLFVSGDAYVKFQTQGSNGWSEDYSFWDAQDSDIDAEKAERYVDAWYYVDPTRLLDAKMAGSKLQYHFRVDWDMDGAFDQVFTLSLDPDKITLVDGETASYKLDAGQVYILNGDGTIEKEVETDNYVSVTPDKTAYQWFAKDGAIGRNVDGYWAGIRVDLPGGAQNATYQLRKAGGTWSEAQPVSGAKETDGNSEYITLWKSLNDLANGAEKIPASQIRFDWNGDGYYDQCVELSIDKENATFLDRRYTVKVFAGEDEVAPDGIDWTYESGAIRSTDTVLETEKVLTKVEVTYDGIKLTLKPEEGKTVTTTFGVTGTQWEPELKVGVVFAVPEYELTEGSALVSEDQFVQTVMMDGTALAKNGDAFYAERSGNVTVTLEWRGSSGTVYARQEYTAKVEYPQAKILVGEPVVEVKGTTDWYITAQKVQVMVEGVQGLVSTEYLPKVKVNDIEQATAGWLSPENDGTYTMDLGDIDTTTTIVYGPELAVEKAATVRVDTVAPYVEVHRTYVDDSGDTIVVFSYTGGESEIVSASIGGYEVPLAGTSDGEEIEVNVTDAGIRIENVVVTVTNGAGVSVDSETKEIRDALKVEVTTNITEIVGEDDDVIYLPDGNAYQLIVMINGDENDGSYKLTNADLTAKDQDDIEIEGVSIEWDEDSGAYTASIPLSNGLSKLEIKVEDSVGRKAEWSNDKTYVIDRTAPRIETSGKDENENEIQVTENGQIYFSSNITFTINVVDEMPGTYSVSYLLNGEETIKDFSGNGQYDLKLKDGDSISNLKVYAKDATGNESEETVISGDTTVIVDTTLPEITVMVSGEGVKKLYTNEATGNFVVVESDQETVAAKVTVTITDKNLDADSVKKFMADNSWGQPEAETIDELVFSRTISVNKYETGSEKFKIKAMDLAGNHASGKKSIANVNDTTVISIEPDSSNEYSFTLGIDRRAPGSTSSGDLKIELNDNGYYFKEVEGKKIFKGNQFTFTISDKSEMGVDSGLLEKPNVMVEGDSEGVSVSCSDIVEGRCTVTLEVAEKYEYGEIVLVVEVADNVANTYSHKYPIAVDNKAPTYEVEVKGEGCNEDDGYRYYTDDVICNVKVEDLNLNGCTVTFVTFVNGKEDRQSITTDVKDGQAFASITLEDGMMLSYVEIEATDVVEHSLSVGEPTQEDARNDVKVVVDRTAPKATLTFSENVKGFYVVDGVVYVILDQAVTGPSGEETGLSPEEVKVTVEITDMNLKIADGWIEGDYDWKGDPAVNQESIVSFVATSGEVQADGTYLFRIDVTVKDLAGNVLEDFATDPVGDGQTLEVAVDDQGHFGFDVAVDRRRPTSDTTDGSVPTIIVDPQLTPTQTEDGKELYDGGFDFNVTITDGDGANDSGIKNVQWSITGGNGVVIEKDNGSGAVSTNGTYTIPVELNGVGESNNVTLMITAEDNVGNIITYEKVFAVDNMGPRVAISQSNKDVHNGSYFDADQIITVEIEDLNFDPDNTTVTTQVSFNGWTQLDGNVYQTQLEYREDGEYTFAMATTDRANNAAQIDYATDLVAVQEFVIDKTAPVVDVQITYQDPSANTVDGVDYYADKVTFDISVSDVNLDGANGATAQVMYKLDTSSDWVTIDMLGGMDNSEVSAQIVLENGQMLTDLQIVVVDNATNIPESVEGFAYDENDGVWIYSGKDIVVDMTDPVAEMSFSNNVVDFYLDGTTVYVIVDPAVTGPSGEETGISTEEVEVTVKIIDMNLKIADGWVEGDYDWQGDPAVNKESTVSFTATSGEVQADGTYLFRIDVTVMDLAGNVLGDFTADPVGDGQTLEVAVDDQGHFGFDVAVDRRRPTSDTTDGSVPTIIVDTQLTPTQTEDGKELYDGSFQFNVTVTDGDGEEDSGVKNVQWSITDENGVVIENDNGSGSVSTDGTYTIPVELNSVGESNMVTLLITAEDNVGNIITYEKVFGVDNMDPRVTISQSNKDVHNGYYFDADQIITVEIEDLNFDPDNTTVTTQVTFDGWTEIGENVYQTQLVYDVDSDYTFAMATTDRANNAAQIDYDTDLVAVQEFVIDKTAPVVDVQITYQDDESNTLEGIDYYSQEVIFDIKVSDVDLDASNGAVAQIMYKLAEGDGWVTIDLTERLEGEDREVLTSTAKITIEHGQVLTDMQIVVIDNATNIPDHIEAFAYDEEAAQWVLTGNDIAVDTVAPEIRVEKTTGQFEQNYQGVDYYNGEISYTIYVSDKFLLDGAGHAELVIEYQYDTKIIDLFEDKDQTIEGEDHYSYTFTVTDGQMVTGMTLYVQDNAGNLIGEALENLKVVDSEDRTEFTYDPETQKWHYAGDDAVVDMTTPTASLTFSDNVKDFYVVDGVVYVILESPVVGESGAQTGMPDEAVTVTIQANDLNLAIGNGIEADLSNGISWVGETAVNNSSTVTYVATNVVGADRTRVFTIDLDVKDLAGNTLKTFISGPTSEGKTIQVVVEDGHFDFQVSIDRRRPSSVDVDDATAPTIEIVPTVTPSKTSDAEGALDLFNSAFAFDIFVSDGDVSSENAGIAYITWTVEDVNGVVKSYTQTVNDSTEGSRFQILVDLQDVTVAGESDEVKLTIIAVDNVGNTTTYETVFGMDVLAPRVTITQSNQDVRNDKYFKDDQVITIEIQDMSFDPLTSIVETEVAFDGWVNVEGEEYTYRTTLVYDVDGDYTFSMTSVDRAMNEAAIDLVTDLVAIQDFVVDKTRPVIHVSYSNNDLIQRMDDVEYYDDDRIVDLVITEHNFRVDDVQVKVGSPESYITALTWAQDGDDHSAEHLFSEGNLYSVMLDYVDLAGNVAVLSNAPEREGYESNLFSVDKTAPEIVINNEEMTIGQIVPVADALDLSFTITDEQSNLDRNGIMVEMLFLGRGFDDAIVPDWESHNNYDLIVSDDRQNATVTISDIPREWACDGIYIVRITAADYSANQTYLGDVVFSVNRFGSSFTADQATREFLVLGEGGKAFHHEVLKDLVITEINPNEVWGDSAHTIEGSMITVSVNGVSTVLQKDVHYTVQKTQKENNRNQWFEYTYTISKDIFYQDDRLKDGEYNVYFYSEDRAGNLNSNESNTGGQIQQDKDGGWTGKMGFTLDSQEPVVTILGLEETTITKDYQTVIINISDSTDTVLEVFVDGIAVGKWDDQKGTDSDWIVYDAETGSFKLNLSQKTDRQTVVVRVTDAAGNQYQDTIEGIMLNEDLWVQYLNNPVLLVLTAVLLVAIMLVVILLITKKKKK